jgi:hypothetical protein
MTDGSVARDSKILRKNFKNQINPVTVLPSRARPDRARYCSAEDYRAPSVLHPSVTRSAGGRVRHDCVTCRRATISTYLYTNCRQAIPKLFQPRRETYLEGGKQGCPED